MKTAGDIVLILMSAVWVYIGCTLLLKGDFEKGIETLELAGIWFIAFQINNINEDKKK